MKADRVKGNQSEQKLGLGAFTGVFVPNVLTILGVILFMRVGWVVGEVGLVQALSILLIANSVTLLTTLSLSAIATSAKVGGGGAYFMISRSLGLEIGGSIGGPFVFCAGRFSCFLCHRLFGITALLFSRFKCQTGRSGSDYTVVCTHLAEFIHCL